MRARRTPRARPAEPDPQLLTEVVLAIFRTNNLLLAWTDRFAAPLGLTSARWQMLWAIALAGESIAAPGIAASMGVTRQGVQKQLDLLMGEGLVERVPNPAHLRSPLYRLTRSGRAVYAKINARWERHAREIAAGMSPGESLSARGFLSTLTARLVFDLAERR